jgi:hypothetical protein
MSALCQNQTKCVAAKSELFDHLVGAVKARSLRVKKENMLRIVERPRLEAREKRLTKQKLSLQWKDARVDVFDDLVADL